MAAHILGGLPYRTEGTVSLQLARQLEQLSNDASQAAEKEVLVGDPIAAAALHPGFVETGFSCGTNQYFYSERSTVPSCGGFGSVRRVYWHNSNTGKLEVLVSKSFSVVRGETDPDALSGRQANIFREGAALRCLAGVPGVPEFRDLVTEPDGTMHIIMGEGPGVSLGLRMKFRGVAGFGLSWQEMRSVLCQLGQVLAQCHEREVVHGDVKPDNIMTTKGCHVTLVDFGMAYLNDGCGWEHQGGTIEYLAPELLLAARERPPRGAPLMFELHGPPVDCWAYGIVAMRLLTGCSLFKPDYGQMPPQIEEEDHDSWGIMCMAKAQRSWEAQRQSCRLHATFQERVELLGAASEEYKRAGTDFLRGLLHPNPSNRLTAQAAVRHPFLTGAFPEVPEDSMPAEIEGDVDAPKTTKERCLRDKCISLIEGWKQDEKGG